MTTLAADPLGNRRVCEGCGELLKGPRGRRHCNATCRARAHRTRKAAKARALLQRLKRDIAELEELVGRD